MLPPLLWRRFWNAPGTRAKNYGGDTALSKTNHALFDEIDKAMDQFVNLLVEHQTSAPDSVKLKAVYNAYLEKLKRAD